MTPPAAIDAQAARSQGFALHAEQRLIEAEALFAVASAAHRADPALAFGLAQTRYELGYPAADLFAQVRKLAPDNLDVARNQALALISEGRAVEARSVLEPLLAAQPDWLDGHKALATLNWTNGDQQHFTDHLAVACRAQPLNPALWLAWFRNLAQARQWQAALSVLDEAERQLGTTPALLVSRLFVAVESGDVRLAEPLLVATEQIKGDVTSLCRIRHALRQGDAKRAEAEALPLTESPSAMLYWPYLSLAWRLLGDARAEWLDRPDQLIQQAEAGWTASELTELAEVLRGLHTAAAPYIEQSVRGGTQTDRSVLLRHEPVLQRIKARLLELIRDFVDGLPPPDPQHPLLSAPRGELLIEGSWSVRLSRQGYNVPHTHAMGWLSTAFYVGLPQPEQMGAAPAGHIAFGQPPAELGLPLEPYCTITPEPGRLAIFPSTLWHGTVPFHGGERLVIAFDIRRPRR
jgi:Putative 2OG-Fe(II) oxygenase